jgi:cytochrome c peroxidase
MNRLRLLAAGTGLVLLALLPFRLAPGQAGGSEQQARSAKVRTLHLPDVLPRYADLELPAHFRNRLVQRFDNTPTDNPLTDAGALLGRVLFYDTRLSVNDTISCASCHQQKHAFADPRRFSKGHADQHGDRNAMSLVNARFYPSGRFFWDERAASLEEQVLGPIQSKAEMGQDLVTLVEDLRGDARYAELFRRAFGDPQVTSERIARALAQFVRSLVSFQSKYDEGLARGASVRADFPNFTVQENHGKAIFLRRCAVCHLPPGQSAVFTMPRPRNNGLDADINVADAGVADVTLNRFQAGQFKSPDLRNVEFTAPYMHDGRFSTLEEVIEFYSSGVKAHPNLDGALRGRPKMSETEKAALVAFLKTLSDHKFITDPRFSDPFAGRSGK